MGIDVDHNNVLEKEIYAKSGEIIGYIREIPAFPMKITIKGETYEKNFHQIWNRFVMKRMGYSRIN